MTFIGLIWHEVWSRRARSLGLAAAVATAVMTVVTLAVTSSGLEQSAAAIITVGKADFTVVQKSVPDILASAIDQGELARVSATRGVASTVGVLVETEHLNANNPVFIEIGINPADLTPFGVTVVAGAPYSATATNQCMVGWRTAANFGLHVGSLFHANGTWNTVTGIYSTGNSFGDSAAMFPLPAEQAYNRLPGIVTLIFVKVAHNVKVATVIKRIDYDMPELTTVRTASQFGRADRDLVFLKAAVNGSTVLAVLIGAVIVGDTMLLTLYQRTREMGILMAIGWTQRRTVGMLVYESLILAVLGAAAGVVFSFVVTAILERLPSLRGVLHANFTTGAFLRALLTALGMTLLGALYPVVQAARLSPLKALSHE